MAFNDSLNFAPAISKLTQTKEPYHVLLSGYLRKSRTFELYDALAQRTKLDARLIPFELPPDYERSDEILIELLNLFKREDNFRSILVSDPFKTRVHDCADEITHRADACGAINVLFKDQFVTGDNIDGAAFRAGAEKGHDIVFAGKKMLVIGCGGVGSAVSVQLALDLKKVGLVDLDVSRAEQLKKLLLKQNPNLTVEIIASPDARNFREYDYVYNATGLGKVNSASPIGPDDVFNSSGIAFDANYTPSKTPFLQTMEQLGYRTINGLSHMMMCTTLHLVGATSTTAGNSTNEKAQIDFELVRETYSALRNDG